MKKVFIIKSVWLALILFGLSIALYGADPDSIYKKIPELNGHNFVPMADVGNPFIKSRLKIGAGFAATESITYESLEVGGKEILSLDGNIYFSDMNIEYQQKVKNWLAIYMNFKFTARFGTQISTLFVEGVNMLSGYDLGWLVRIHKGEKHYLSGHIELSDYRANFIHLNRLILNIVEDTIMTSTENIPALFGSTGLRYAWAPNKLLGFGVTGGFGFGESFDRGNTRFFGSLKIYSDINLYQSTGVPVGLALKYNISSMPSFKMTNDKHASSAGLKLAYMGGNDYILGFEAAWLNFPTISSDSFLNAISLSVQFHLYF